MLKVSASATRVDMGIFAQKVAKRSVVYVLANGFMAILSALAYTINSNGLRQENVFHKHLCFASSFVFVSLSICFYFYFLKSAFGKPRIHPNKDSSDHAELSALRGLLVDHALIDALSFSVVCNFMDFDSFPELSSALFVREFVDFIPKSVLSELIFDFLHYWTHRICHMNKTLYKYVHYGHHVHTHPGILSTYVMHPLDYIVTNCLPLWITLQLGPRLSPIQVHLFLAYKMFVEVGGHTGLKGYFSCPQFPFLAWYSDYMILYSEDHSWHHLMPNKNFAKRYALWDHVFGTYDEPRFECLSQKKEQQ